MPCAIYETAESMAGMTLMSAVARTTIRIRALMVMGAAFLVLLPKLCMAETRWCSIGKANTDTLIYPPVARVAHITGVVISRITFLPSGRVIAVDEISGPLFIAKNVSEQIKKWTVRTDARGEEPCQALLVAGFQIGDAESNEPKAKPVPPSIYRMEITAHPVVLFVQSDPSPQRICSRRRWYLSFQRKCRV
jgi:hypothetical protein